MAAAVLAAGCSPSDGDRAETTTTGAGPKTTASSSSTAEPGSTTTITPPDEPGSGGSACDLVGPDDVTAAGVEGAVRRGGDVSESFNISGNLESTACEFDVDQGTRQANLIVVVAEDVGADEFDDATDSSFDKPEKVDGVGDRAALSSEDDDGRSKLTLWAVQGNRLVKIIGARADVTPRSVLEALAAHTLVA